MTATATLRPFRWPDLEGLARLLGRVEGPWSNRGYEDPETLAQELTQPPRDPRRECYLVEEGDGRLVGFLWMVVERPIGRVEARLGVDPGRRRRGIGRRLLRRAVELAGRWGLEVVHVETPAEGTACHRLLESEGFRPVRTYWRMVREDGPLPPYQLPPGLYLRSFRRGVDEETLTALQNRAFEGSWGYCPNTVEEIAARTGAKGQDPEAILFIVRGERAVAYNWTRVDAGARDPQGVVCMTGVDPEERGRGLGKAVLLAGLHYLASRGVRRVSLEVDGSNGPATHLYLSLGFRKERETVWYERRLGPQRRGDGGSEGEGSTPGDGTST